MPAQNLYHKDEKGIYSHVYNRGVEKRIIFADSQDYEVFIGYLRDYSTASQDPDSIKKTFKVRGRIFRGTPHQPKNYFNKIELIAYSLMPDHFHLILRQITRGSIERFIRSLCTRYSMYFNKKYQHTGALFEGPYKSVQLEDGSHLLHLTRYLHHSGSHSSYAEYLGTRETSWVKSKVVLSFWGKGTGAYKDFVQKYETDQKENANLTGITFDSEAQHIGTSDAERDKAIYSDPVLETRSRIPEFLASTVVFLLLVGLGVRNIMASTIKSPNPSPVPIQSGSAPSVLSTTKDIKETSNSSPADAAKPKIIVTIRTNDGATSVNIRQKPAVDSESIGKAKNGDTFELVSIDLGWYGIKLADDSTGFVSARYIEIGETDN